MVSEKNERHLYRIALGYGILGMIILICPWLIIDYGLMLWLIFMFGIVAMVTVLSACLQFDYDWGIMDTSSVEYTKPPIYTYYIVGAALSYMLIGWLCFPFEDMEDGGKGELFGAFRIAYTMFAFAQWILFSYSPISKKKT